MKFCLPPLLTTGLIASVLILFSLPAVAWSNHALGTWQALSNLLAIGKTEAVRTESLASFLNAEGIFLESLLQQEEKWARINVPEYPQRPDNFSFQSSKDAKQNRQRFLAALRVNPQAKLPLYLQLLPGADTRGKPLLPWHEVTTLKHSLSVKNGQFLSLVEGEMLAPLDVVASASDEPDYGFDLGLWNNNTPDLGYAFGKQPFGNSALEYSSQAPFHLGFFHESAIVYKAAGFLRRTYPEYRIHLYQTLSKHAFNTGHAYWGWRFAGWALHYVQDLTQPYHTKVLPGLSVAHMLWINAVDMAGAHASKKNIITLVSNRHAALENYQYFRMHAAYLRKDTHDALLRAARGTQTSLRTTQPYSFSQIRQEISRQSHALADETDALLEQSLPRKYISDSSYIFGETEPDLNVFIIMASATLEQQIRMTESTANLMRNFGTHTRAFVLATVAIDPTIK